MKLSRRKFNYALLAFLMLAVEIAIYNIWVRSMDTDQGLILVSATSACVFFLELFIWKRLTGELLSPYIVFFVVLFIFCCGQSLGWIFGVEMGDRDLWNRSTYGMTHELLLQGMYYSMIGITCFFIGSIVGKKIDTHNDICTYISSESVISAYKNIGKIMLVLCVPAFLAITLQNIVAVSASGYLAYYDVSASRSTIMKIANQIAEFYQPCLLILLIAYREKKHIRISILIAMLIDVLASLYVGGRSGAFMTLLGIIVAYHYFIKPFTRKQIILGGIAGYFAMAMSNAISISRVDSGRSILDFIVGIFSGTNVISEFIGELGWNLTSICWTMKLVPSSYPFRYGMSYLVSLLTLIPSSFFGGKHPIVTWANLGDWLQSSLGLTSGPGYTMVAESYINFGWFGVLALFVEGIIIAKAIARVDRRNTENNLLGSTFQVITIMTVMKSLTRASVSSAMRTILLVIVPLYIIIKLSLRKSIDE